MNRVHLLPEHVANQIAAGEVIERPASVVKELVENSLDAKAGRVAVEIVAAGRSCIRVIDDGCGMSRDDALLCLERHATSKITSAGDLARVTTMGFRGEAIPTIASVSRFTLTTREYNSADVTAPGTRIVMSGGKILEVREAGSPPGTTVEVRSLFFNVPARRKFLRSDETERARIQHWLTTAALAHPQVAFSLTLEGRVIWQLPALPQSDSPATQLNSLRERLRLLLGEGLTWIALDAKGELAGAMIAPADGGHAPEFSPSARAAVWGWIGAPGVSRASRDDLHLFVNRRPVENRGLNAALVEGYHNSLMKGRHPVACLFLEVDPAEVDVNIHPSKREVKFHRERAIRTLVVDAVRGALKSWHNQPANQGRSAAADQLVERGPASLFSTGPSTEFSLPAPPLETRAPPVGASQFELVSLEPSANTKSLPALDVSTGLVDAIRLTRASAAQAGILPDPSGGAPGPKSADGSGFASLPAPAARAAVPGPRPDDATPLLSVPLRLVGVIGRLYVILESDRGLVLLDQHAAHERVLYEQTLRRLEHDGTAPSQRLLLPETIELSPRDAAFLRENLPALSRLGVGLSEFGERTFLLDALPPYVKSTSPRRFASELVDELRAAGASVNAWRLGESLVAKTVCRHSVKANDPLAGLELEALVEDLRRCEMPYTCPHGRPTLIEMNFRELEKRFGRIQG